MVIAHLEEEDGGDPLRGWWSTQRMVVVHLEEEEDRVPRRLTSVEVIEVETTLPPDGAGVCAGFRAPTHGSVMLYDPEDDRAALDPALLTEP